jgi:hypothetical protein
MSRPRHPDKHIESAVQYAESLGWRVRMASGHAWGHLYCPLEAREGCRLSVWSTPKNAENHARHLRRDIDNCPHDQGPPPNQEEDDDDEDAGPV